MFNLFYYSHPNLAHFLKVRVDFSDDEKSQKPSKSLEKITFLEKFFKKFEKTQ